MQTFQNSRIRVTVSNNIVAEFSRQITLCSLGKNETPEQAVRGRILSAAMSKLGNRSELTHMNNEQIENEDVIKVAHSILMHQYLEEHSKYNVNETLFRYTNGHHLFEGQALEIDSANAYAKGVLSPMSAQESRKEIIKYLSLGKNDTANPRTIKTISKRMALFSNAADVSAAQAILESANSLFYQKQVEMDYREKMARDDGWTIEVIGDLPEIIGVCRVSQ